MAGVTLQDVIVPQLFTPYTVQKTMEKSALYQSGIIAVSYTHLDVYKRQVGYHTINN